MDFKNALQSLNNFGDSSHLDFSTGQKICRWVAFALLIVHYFFFRIVLEGLTPTFWLSGTGIVAIVLSVRLRTYRVGVFFAYLLFIIVSVLFIMLFCGQFDPKVYEELAKIANKEGLTIDEVASKTIAGGVVLCVVSVVCIGLLFVKKWENKIPSIFLGFLLIVPIVARIFG
ncbi:hypothetical protein [Helicobacter sp. T3_23-1056]